MYWQVYETNIETYYLYEAYLDVRRHTTQRPVVRILGMAKQWKNEKLFCNFWFNHTKAVKSEPVTFEYISNRKYFKSDFPWPFMITCKIPRNYRKEIPISVTLTGKSCQRPSNNLR